MSVAVNGSVHGKALPLVVMSHGNGGSFLGHYDTAIALADAGFVVAAVTHTGDNYTDQSRGTDVMDRPRQMSRVIDHMLSSWDGRGTIDAARVGMFGFSSGAFISLASIGGIPDFGTIAPMCRQYSGDFVCQLIAKSGSVSGSSNVTAPPASAIARAADPRIKAAVMAAPATYRSRADCAAPGTASARLSGRCQCRALRLSGAMQHFTGVDGAHHFHQCSRLRPGSVSRKLQRGGRGLFQQDDRRRFEHLIRPMPR